MLQVSRDRGLKIPKKTLVNIKVNNNLDILEVKKALALADNKKFEKDKVMEKIDKDNDLEFISKIPYNSNDLIVITKAKKLSAYIITITQKSPSKFRGVFVNRMQNYSLDIIEDLLRANFIRVDSLENKKLREKYQKNAIINLKMLGYISMLAESSNCILLRQYKQISMQVADVINLILAWKKSDDNRFRRKNNGF